MRNFFILLVAALLFTLKLYSMQYNNDKSVKLKGRLDFASHIQVKVSHDVLTTTFIRNTENITITVKKKTGEVISQQTVDAKEFDEVITQIKDYKEGEYIIEISSPQGMAYGEF